MKKGLAFSLLCLVIAFAGCNKNGFEGDVKVFNTDKNVSGIKLQATTTTDIKEEQGKATRVGTSNQKGRYSIRGLLPNRKYRITSADSRFASRSISEIAPEKGTRIIDTPLFVCPSPEANGIWFYNTEDASFKQIDGKDAPRLRPRIHAGLLPGMWSRNAAYSISDNDALKVSASIPTRGLIIVQGRVSETIVPLYKVSPLNVRNWHVQAGWYFNVSDFRIDNWGDLVPSVNELQLGNVFQEGDLVAIPVENLAEGLYFFITRSAVIQRSAIQGNLNQPQEGYLVRVGAAQTQAPENINEIAQEDSSLRAATRRAIKSATDAYTQAAGLLSSIHNGREADLNAMKADLDGLKAAIETCRNLFTNGKLADAKDTAEAVADKAKAISEQLQKAIDRSGGQASDQVNALLEKYFLAVRQNDNNVMSSLALEPFQPDLNTWKVLAIGKEDVEPAKLPTLAAAELEAKRAQDAQIGPTLDADSALRAAPPGRVSELRTKYEMENTKMKELKRAYNAAKAAAAMEEEITLFSLGVREMQSVRELGGTVHTRRVEVAITTSQGNTRSYNIHMRRYLLQGPTLTREGRWVIIRFEPV